MQSDWKKKKKKSEFFNGERIKERSDLEITLDQLFVSNWGEMNTKTRSAFTEGVFGYTIVYQLSSYTFPPIGARRRFEPGGN